MASEADGPRPRRRQLLFVAILGVGFLLRLTYLLEISRQPDFDLPQFEAQYHDYWARALRSGDWTPPEGVTDPEIPQRPYFRPPGYPFFLAAIYGGFGASYFWPRAIQMLLGLVSCWLLHRLTRRVFGAPAALGALALATIYWLFIFFEGELMAVSLLIFLLLLLLDLATRWVDAFPASSALAVGALVGLATLVRPNAAVVTPVLLLWAAWLVARRRGNRALLGREFLLPASCLVAVFVLVTLPATLRNHRVAQDSVWITSNAGVNLFVGTHPESNGFQAAVPELGAISGLEDGWDSFDYPKIAAGVEELAGQSLKDSEVSSYFTRRALDFAFEQPAAVATLMAKKVALFWGPAEVSNNKVLYFERRNSPTLRFGPSFATILALALTGLLFFLWDLRGASSGQETRGVSAGGNERGALLLLVVGAYFASFLPFFVSARFRAPLIPLLMVFAGHALARLWQSLSEQRWRALATGVVVLIGLRVLAGIAWVPYEPNKALWHWRKALLWQAKGEPGIAVAEFHNAVAEDPEDAEMRLSLAESLVATGETDQAIEEYRATLALDPRSLPAHNNLARLLAGRGDLDTAIGHWTAVLELEPDRLSALNNLAFALSRRGDAEAGDLDRAVQLAEHAAALTRHGDPRVLVTLATVYQSAGRTSDALEARRAAERLASARPTP